MSVCNMKLARGVLALMLSMLVPSVLAAQHLEIGTIHSPQGFGFYASRGAANAEWVGTVGVTADMYGVLSGTHSYPGLKARYNHLVVFQSWEARDFTVGLYAGPGLAAGYLRDYGKPFGGMAGLNCAVGLQARMARNIDLALEFDSDIAFHLGRDPRYGTLQISMYKAGLERFYYPHIKISFRL